jgi:hypothetical protein
MIFSYPQLSRLVWIKPSADLSVDANGLSYVGKTIGLQKARKLLVNPAREAGTLIYQSAVDLHQRRTGADTGISIFS